MKVSKAEISDFLVPYLVHPFGLHPILGSCRKVLFLRGPYQAVWLQDTIYEGL